MMQKHRNIKTQIGAISLACALSSASAATVTWTTASITGDSDVNNLGATVVALNGAHSGVSANRVVNGVTFAPSSGLLSGNFAGDVWTGAGTGDYQLLLSNVDFQGNGTGDFALTTIAGLTIGDTYVFQYWYADDNWQNPTPDRNITLTINNTGLSPANTQSGDNSITGVEFATGTSPSQNQNQDWRGFLQRHWR